MKMRLFLFLFFACTLLGGRAMAQGCSTKPIDFPATSDKLVPSGTCIANADSGSATGQGGRLRWNGRTLELFDSDDSGQPLWCANPDNSNGGSSGDTSNCFAKNGSILCLQHDGNMVIYAPNGGVQPHCVNDGDGGAFVWASGTENTIFTPPTNDGSEQLLVKEDVFFEGAKRTGDRAVIQDVTYGGLWVSLGYVD